MLKKQRKCELQRRTEKGGDNIQLVLTSESFLNIAVDYFLTHSLWNSTLKGITSRVPVVACQIYNDKVVNTMLVQGFWKNGIIVNATECGIVEREEF